VGQITKISSTLVYYGCSVHAFEAVNCLCVERRTDYIDRFDHPEALPVAARPTTFADALYWPPIGRCIINPHPWNNSCRNSRFQNSGCIRCLLLVMNDGIVGCCCSYRFCCLLNICWGYIRGQEYNYRTETYSVKAWCMCRDGQLYCRVFV